MMKDVDTPTEELKRAPAAFTDRVTADGRFGGQVPLALPR